ncbi:MAG: 23S rRNA (adenine(1618)-N(6))-methyltransferase RlmF [Winogradskyella sp.]
MHKNNLHSKGYDFETLIQRYPKLISYVFANKYGSETIDFSNPDAVKTLNSALLKTYYSINYWEFSDDNLCPPIPGRVEYIHVLYDLLKSSNLNKSIKVLDIGTGATCIYPLLGTSIYNWHFIASEIDKNSFKNANHIVQKNNLQSLIELRLQTKSESILDGILDASEVVTATMCNPPFYKNESEAIENTSRKLKGLGKTNKGFVRNFSGTSNELWYKGGEKAFLHNYIYQSSKLRTNCFWYTSLVSKKELIKDLKKSLKKLGATEIKLLDVSLGNKISRVVAWTFLTKKEQQHWNY